MIYHYLIDKKMAALREIFIDNLKKKRRDCGFSQEKLAEMTEVSAHHIAMIETGRNFPTTDLIERMAAAMNIQAFELFMDKTYYAEVQHEQLRKEIKQDIQQLFTDFLNKIEIDNCIKK